jgi:hypothetical protein
MERLAPALLPEMFDWSSRVERFTQITSSLLPTTCDHARAGVVLHH